MNPHSHLRQQEQEQQAHSETLSGKSGHEFGSVEELLRHDASKTQVPAAVSERLGKSLADEPKPAPSWWRKVFSRDA